MPVPGCPSPVPQPESHTGELSRLILFTIRYRSYISIFTVTPACPILPSKHHRQPRPSAPVRCLVPAGGDAADDIPTVRQAPGYAAREGTDPVPSLGPEHGRPGPVPGLAARHRGSAGSGCNR